MGTWRASSVASGEGRTRSARGNERETQEERESDEPSHAAEYRRYATRALTSTESSSSAGTGRE